MRNAQDADVLASDLSLSAAGAVAAIDQATKRWALGVLEVGVIGVRVLEVGVIGVRVIEANLIDRVVRADGGPFTAAGLNANSGSGDLAE